MAYKNHSARLLLLIPFASFLPRLNIACTHSNNAHITLNMYARYLVEWGNNTLIVYQSRQQTMMH